MGITRLGLYGGPRSLYGSFEGKANEVIVVVPTVDAKKWYPKPEKKLPTIRSLEIEQEEFELMAVVKVLIRCLL